MGDKRDIVEAPPNTRLILIQAGLLSTVWRHRRMFTAILVSILLLSLVASFVIPARYLATGMVIVAEADPATQTSDVWAQKQGDPADLESQIMILRSARLMKLALAQPGALKAAEEVCRNFDGGCANISADSAQLVEKVAERYSVSAVGRSRVLSISYTSASPDSAMTMANALVSAYLNDQKSSESSSRAVAAKWLWEEVSNLDKEIRTQIIKIDTFRRENGLVQGAKASISSESLTSSSEQLAVAEQAKAQALAKLDAIRDIKSGREVSDYQMALDNRTVGDIKQQIAILANQLAASRAILGERHPQRQMLEASLDLLQQQLKGEIDRVATSAQKDYETARNLVVTLQQQVKEAKNNASNALADESSLEGMVRDVDAKRQLYAQLYQRASELETERRSLSGGGRLVSLAEKPLKPSFPKKLPMLAAGFALGIFLSAASCVLWDRFKYGRSQDEATNDPGMAPVFDLAFDGAEESGKQTNDNAHAQRDNARALLDPGRAQQGGTRGSQWDDKQTFLPPLPIIGTLPNLPIIGLNVNSNDKLLSLQRQCMLSVGFKRSVKILATDLFEACAGQPVLVVPTKRNSRSASFLTLVIGQELAKRGLNVLLIECASASCEFATAFSLPKNQPTLSDVLTGFVTPSAGVSRHSPNLHLIAGDDTTLGLLDAGGVRGLETLVAWAQTYDLVLLSGPALLEPRSRRALAVFATLGVNALVGVERDEYHQQTLADAGAMVATAGLRSWGAVLMPTLGTSSGAVQSRDRHRVTT